MNMKREENLEATIRMLRKKLQDLEAAAKPIISSKRKVKKKEVKLDDSNKDAAAGDPVERNG